jgi:uncharacterized protein YegL
MRRDLVRLLAAIACIALFGGFALAAPLPNDIVLMIDNSGSMKTGDPLFMIKDALTEFVENLSMALESTQVAVLIFDHRVHLAVPLTIITEATKGDILLSLERIDYQGKLTDIPAAMERAIYELKSRGQEGSQKSIIFITDGIVDTGDKNRDLDAVRWLRESLSEDAVKHGIRIFGIAFTDAADFELIQFLAQKTKSAYYRAYAPEEISDVFSQIHHHLESVSSAAIDPGLVPAPAPELPPVTPSRPGIESAPIYVTEAPAPTPPPIPVERTSPVVFIMAALAVFALAAAFFLIYNRRRRRRSRPVSLEASVSVDERLPEASLKDINGITKKGTFRLRKRVTKIGRIDKINDLVIPHETISRQHALIEYKDYFFWVVDQKSSNGTFVNGERIVDRRRLNHGDRLSFDIYAFEFGMPGMTSDETIVDKTVFRRDSDLSGGQS